MVEFKDAREKVLHEAEYDIEDDDTRRELVQEFLQHKTDLCGPSKVLRNALAFAKKMLETEDLATVEIYCQLIQKRKYKKPAEFYDFVSTLDLDEQDKFAEQAREMMMRVTE
jgi:hypothetical protein